MANPRTASRRERRKAADKRQKVALDSAKWGGAQGLADGEAAFRLERSGETKIVVPSPADPRRDLFEYHPGTWVIRGLTMLARAQGWRLADA